MKRRRHGWLVVTACIVCVALYWIGVACQTPAPGNETSDSEKVPVEQTNIEKPVTDGGTVEARPDGSQVETPPDEPKASVDPQKEGYAAICPGARDCLSNRGALQVGASAVKITPEKYEVARWSYFQEEGFCPAPTPLSPHGINRCGTLHDDAASERRDCGLDGICPRDNIRTKASCNKDNTCTNDMVCNKSDQRCYITYKAPDADGSEGDGQPDYFLDCGRDRICPCLDPTGQPAYYGANKQCLKGHKPNPAYQGPDADGSEGDGQFQAMWMGGFTGNHPLQGVHDDTWARAIVLESGDTAVAIVSIDTVGFFFDDVEKARKLVQDKLPAGAIDYVLVSSTHTHEGPDTMGQWGPRKNGLPSGTGRDPAYQKQVIDAIAQAVMEAYQKRQPARLRVGRIRTGVAGLAKDTRAPFIFDDTLLALHATTPQGDTIATLVNWGNHPEVLSDINNFLSSDYCHYVREALEKGVSLTGKGTAVRGLGGVAIFVQGALGGLIAPLGLSTPDLEGTVQKGSTWERARALGHQVALFAQQALEKGEVLSQTDVSVWARPLQLKVENRVFHVAFSLGFLSSRKSVGYNDQLPISPTNMPKIISEIAMIRVGSLTFYSMPGELDPQILVGGYDGSFSYGNDIINDQKHPNLRAEMKQKAPPGPYLKERIPGTYKFFVGLGNDQLGYLLAKWNFKVSEKNPYFEEASGDHYEETNSLGPDTVPDLLTAYQEMLQRALRSAR